MNNLGTWIDWQYLQNAAKLLAKCRYTLQYTYPYAYYMESGPRKKLALPWLPSPLLLTLLLYPYSLNTSRLSWRLRSKTCRGKWSGRTAMTEGT